MSSFYFWHWRICVLMRLNKGAKKFLTLTIAAAMLSGMTACGGVTGGPTESNDGPKESVNAEMVQLNVYNYDGGYEQST